MTTATFKYSTRIKDKLPKHLDKVDKQAKKTDKSLKKVKRTSETIGTKTRTKVITKDIKSMGQAAERSSKGISNFTLALGAAFLGAVAFVHVIRRFDALTNMSNKLKLITQDNKDLADTQQRLIDLAVRTRSDLDALVTTYQRVDKALARMGSSAEDTMGVTEALALGIKTTGIASDEATAALRQITQAFNKGKLDGDEFRSVGENMPVVLDAIAKEANISRAELMDWARQGKITSDLMQRGLLKALPQLREDFKKIEPTFGDLGTGLSAAWTDFIDSITKSRTTLGGFFDWLKRVIHNMTVDLQNLAKFFEDMRIRSAKRDVAGLPELQKVQEQRLAQLGSKDRQGTLTRSEAIEMTDLIRQIGETKAKLAEAEAIIDPGKGSRGTTPYDTPTKGQEAFDAIRNRVRGAQSQLAQGTITSDVAQQVFKGARGDLATLPLNEAFAKDLADPKLGAKSRKELEGLRKELEALIIPTKKATKATKEAKVELTEREKFEKKTIEAMDEINKQRIVIQTQQKLGAITDKEAAEALVQLGIRKKNLKAEYLAEIATNDELKGSLTTLNNVFDQLGGKVDPVIQRAKAKLVDDAERQKASDFYGGELEQERQRKAALSDARTSAAVGLGKQAATGLLSEVGGQFATYEEGGVEMKAGGTAIDSLNAGIEKFIETGDPLQALFAALGPVVRDVTKALLPLLDIFTKSFGKVIKSFNALIPILADAIAPLLNAIAPLMEAVAVVLDAIGVVLKAITPILEHVVAPVLKFISVVIKAIVDGLAIALNAIIDFVNLFGAGIEHIKTSDQLESAALKSPDEETAGEGDTTEDLLRQQLDEQKRLREISEQQLKAQLDTERKNAEFFRQAAQEAFTVSAAGVTGLNGDQPPITIINSIDPTDIDNRIASEGGQQAILNTIRLNQEDISEVVRQ